MCGHICVLLLKTAVKENKKKENRVKILSRHIFHIYFLKLWNYGFVLCFDSALLSFIFNIAVDVCIHNIWEHFWGMRIVSQKCWRGRKVVGSFWKDLALCISTSVRFGLLVWGSFGFVFFFWESKTGKKWAQNVVSKSEVHYFLKVKNSMILWQYYVWEA